VLLLQETKTTDQEFPIDDLGDLGYDCELTGERSYNGVAICARERISEVHKSLPGDPQDQQRRYLSAVVEGVRFVNVYVPHGQAVGSDKYHYKLAWLTRLAEQLTALGAPAAPIVVSGDYNIALTDALDVWDAAALAGSTHVSEPERAAFRGLLDRGMVDSFRVTPTLLPRVKSVVIDRVARMEDRASDHAPVTLTLD
jgi:exodeoxyribonuclease-3